jgi:hypothetical protein
VKVVDLVTQSTTKFGLQLLDFSIILYDFCKIQAKHKTKEESSFTTTPGSFRLSQNCPCL